MPYVEFDVPRGSAAGIARFYRELIGATTAVLEQRDGAAVACVDAGPRTAAAVR